MLIHTRINAAELVSISYLGARKVWLVCTACFSMRGISLGIRIAWVPASGCYLSTACQEKQSFLSITLCLSCSCRTLCAPPWLFPLVLLLLPCLFFTSSFFLTSGSFWSKQVEAASLPLLTKDPKLQLHLPVYISYRIKERAVTPSADIAASSPHAACLHLNQFLEDSSWRVKFSSMLWNQVMPPLQGKSPLQITGFFCSLFGKMICLDYCRYCYCFIFRNGSV